MPARYIPLLVLTFVWFLEESSFHFLPSSVGSTSPPSSHHVVVGGGSLCRQVPALLGLGDGQPPHHRHPQMQCQQQVGGSKSPGSRHHAAGSSNGFYKRLLEWLSRKKKSHRRYSEVVLPDHYPVDPHRRESLHGLMAVASNGRNQSAPMIFDVSKPVARGNRYAFRNSKFGAPVEDSSSQSSRNTKCSSTSSSSTLSSSTVSSSSSLSSAPPPPPPPPNVKEQQYLTVDVSESRLLGFEAPPTTPTSSYSQAGIIQFEKQESEDKTAEIDAEWIIPWSDIQVGPVISQRGTCTINR